MLETQLQWSMLKRLEQGLQTQIQNLLSNTDDVALNSLAELVQQYTANGATYTSSLATEVARAQAAQLAAVTRLNALEAMVASLQFGSSN